MSKEIPLTQGKVALVDDEYYDALVAMGSWRYSSRGTVIHCKSKKSLQFYVCFLANRQIECPIYHLDNNILNNMSKNLLCTTKERFWRFIYKKGIDECWSWLGVIHKKGYGYFKFKGQMRPASRIMFEFETGINPGNKCVCHTCDHPWCVNPKHLWLGTVEDNNKDRDRKGRGGSAPGILHGMSKFTEKDIKEIRSSLLIDRQLGQKYSVAHGTINCIKNRKTWKHV